MAVFNAAKREIDLKIVYYGPAMCGKTTNVQSIHKMLAPQQRGELMSLATKDDRTLFFDFLPIELGDVRGFKTRFHIYTVPGQVYYGLTRRAVLTGADGVVFVVDSQTNKLQDNIESLKDLAENLKFYKKDLASFPFVFQYNKRDLPHVAPVDELDSMLNQLNVPSFESSAVTGMGVVETLTAICKLVLKQMDSGTAKKKPLQPQASMPPAAKPAAPAARSSVAPDDTGLRIFTEEPSAPSHGMRTEPVPPQPVPSAPAAMPEQKPSLRLRPTEPAPLSLDTAPPPAVPPIESKSEPQLDDINLEAAPESEPQFDGMNPQSPPPFDAGSSDMSADIGLSFDDDVVLDETAEQEPELSFDADSSDLVIEEPAFDMDETGLSFDDDYDAGPSELPAADSAVQPAFIEDDSSAYTLETPSLEFEEPQGAEAPSPTPAQQAPSVPDISIVACGSPRKISDTSISLPITLKLNKDDTECSISITISLDNMPL